MASSPRRHGATVRATASLRSRNLLRITLESLPVPVIVLDGQGRVRYANQCARAFGPHDLSVRDAYHMPFEQYVAPINGGRVGAELRRAAERLAGGRHRSEAEGQHREFGHVRIAALHADVHEAGHVVIIWPNDESNMRDTSTRDAIARAMDDAIRGLHAAKQTLDYIDEPANELEPDA